MRELAVFEDEKTAQLFADVLCARDIATDVSKTRAGFTVWVIDEKDVEASRTAWAAFDAKPDAPEHLAAAGCVERKQRREEVEQRKSRHEVIDVRSSWHGTPVRPPVVTLLLVALSIVATLAAKFSSYDVRALLSIGTIEDAMTGQLFGHVLQGQVWRLVTPIFLHSGFVHILFNMWWLLDLGSVLETRIRSFRFFLLVTFTGALSNVAQYLVTGSPLFGGMSGVLYALFGYIWVRARLDPALGLAMPRSTALVLSIWLVLGFTGVLGPVANFAHLGGLVAGAVVGLLSSIR
jgi:GlpG protein